MGGVLATTRIHTLLLSTRLGVGAGPGAGAGAGAAIIAHLLTGGCVMV